MAGARVQIGSRRFRSPAGRPLSVWLALLFGVVALLVAVGIAVAVAGLIGSADAASAGVLDVPVLRCVFVVGLGGLVATVASVCPLWATASVAVDQSAQVLPWITDLIARSG